MAEKNTLANPAPLGLMGFGMTTVLLNIHNANPSVLPIGSMILAMGIFYGGLAQIIAGILEFRKGNTFGVTAFTSYGLFWLSLVALLIIPNIVPGINPPHATLHVGAVHYVYVCWHTEKESSVICSFLHTVYPLLSIGT